MIGLKTRIWPLLAAATVMTGNSSARSVSEVSNELTDKPFAVRIHFGGLVAFAPFGAGVETGKPVTKDQDVGGVWALLPRGNNAKTVSDLSDKNPNFRSAEGQLLPLHHAFIKVAAKNLFGVGGDAPILISLAHDDPLNPDPTKPARYEVVFTTTGSKKKATLKNFSLVPPVRDKLTGAGEFAKIEPTATSTDAAELKKSPLIARILFQSEEVLDAGSPLMIGSKKVTFGWVSRTCKPGANGYSCSVSAPADDFELSSHVTATVSNVSDPFAIELKAIDAAGSKRYTLSPATPGEAIDIWVLNTPAAEVVGVPSDPEEEQYEHFKMLHLISKTPGKTDYWFPKIKKVEGDPFCTPNAQFVAE